jgi:hypothetical protein
MALLAAIIIFKAALYLFLLTMAGLLLFALISETIESIRDRNRRAARVAAHVPRAPSILEGLFRRLRHSLHFWSAAKARGQHRKWKAPPEESGAKGRVTWLTNTTPQREGILDHGPTRERGQHRQPRPI